MTLAQSIADISDWRNIALACTALNDGAMTPRIFKAACAAAARGARTRRREAEMVATSILAQISIIQARGASAVSVSTNGGRLAITETNKSRSVFRGVYKKYTDTPLLLSGEPTPTRLSIGTFAIPSVLLAGTFDDDSTLGIEHGLACVTFYDKSEFRGAVSRGERHGHGVELFFDGREDMNGCWPGHRRFNEGEWADDVRHGLGLSHNTDQFECTLGMYHNGQPIGTHLCLGRRSEDGRPVSTREVECIWHESKG